MIAFKCPYCGAELTVGDDYARRQGWCRQCKNVLTIPAVTGQPCPAMSAPERLAALERLFPIAAERADGYRLLYEAAKASLNQETRMAEVLDAVAAEQARLDAMIRAQADRTTYLADDADARGRRFEEFAHRFARLCADLEADQEWREAVINRVAWLESASETPREAPAPVDAEALACVETAISELGESIRQKDAALREQLDRLQINGAETAALAAAANQAAVEARSDAVQLRDAHEGHRRIATELAEALGAMQKRIDDSAAIQERTDSTLQGLVEQVGRLDNLVNAFLTEATQAAEAAETAANAPVPPDQQLALQPEGVTDGADMGQQAVLAAFLRFMGQQPRNAPPGT